MPKIIIALGVIAIALIIALGVLSLSWKASLSTAPRAAL
jgi:hypothetical protein